MDVDAELAKIRREHGHRQPTVQERLDAAIERRLPPGDR